MIVKTDQEPAIIAVRDNLAKLREGARTVPEESPVKSSGSNGIVERAIQAVESQLRTMKMALEKRWGKSVPDNHPIVTWMVEYGAFLLSRFEVGKDGKTGYERNKGKKAKVNGFEFGEGVMFKRKPIGKGLGKLSTMWEEGVYLGVRALSGELIVGTAKGVWRTRTMHRKTVEERWDCFNADRVGEFLGESVLKMKMQMVRCQW